MENTVEKWLIEHYEVLFQERKMRNGKIRMFIPQTQGNDSYKEYYKQRKNQRSPKKINQTMTNLGFELLYTTMNKKSIVIWTMDKTKFDDLITRLNVSQ